MNNICIFENRKCKWADNEDGAFSCTCPSDSEMPCRSFKMNAYVIVIGNEDFKELNTTDELYEEYLGDNEGWSEHIWAEGLVYTEDDFAREYYTNNDPMGDGHGER